MTGSALKARKTSLIVGLFLALVIAGLFWYQSVAVAPEVSFTTSVVTVGNAQFQVAIADTHEERRRGLGGTEPLPDNAGMLFLFEEPSQHCFWMKDVDYSLDILWVGPDNKVIAIERDVRPDTFPHSFCPEEPASYVLEIRGGQAANQGITVGDELAVNL